MSEPVYIIGGGRTDFKRNLKKEGKTIRHLIIEAGKKAIDDAKIDAGEVQAGTVGNFNAGQFTKQLQLGAFIPEIDPKLRGIPTIHTEAACASGALSVLLGAEWIMGGLYDVVLAGFGRQSDGCSAAEGFRLRADHGRRGFGRARVWKISGQDRPRTKQNAAIARVRSHDRLPAAR